MLCTDVTRLAGALYIWKPLLQAGPVGAIVEKTRGAREQRARYNIFIPFHIINNNTYSYRYSRSIFPYPTAALALSLAIPETALHLERRSRIMRLRPGAENKYASKLLSIRFSIVTSPA